MAADAALALLGFVSRVGAVASWGIAIAKDELLVSSAMETNRPGIHAAGDIVAYAGQLKRIATAQAEAAVVVNGAVRFIHPEARFALGHSSGDGAHLPPVLPERLGTGGRPAPAPGGRPRRTSHRGVLNRSIPRTAN